LPDISVQYPELDPEDGPYLTSCQVFDVELTASYRGRALPGLEVYVSGFALSPSGLSGTDENGKVYATIAFDGTQLGQYALIGRDYVLTLNGVSQTFEGPRPLQFSFCGGF
jgi:hypothetical protein